jgi:hypothetical protein
LKFTVKKFKKASITFFGTVFFEIVNSVNYFGIILEIFWKFFGNFLKFLKFLILESLVFFGNVCSRFNLQCIGEQYGWHLCKAREKNDKLNFYAAKHFPQWASVTAGLANYLQLLLMMSQMLSQIPYNQ